MSYGILNPMDENWPRGQFTMGFKIPYDTGAKENTQTKNFVEHPDRPTWQYCRSLWFSARSVWRSNEFQKVWNRFYITYNILYFSSERILVKITQTFFLLIPVSYGILNPMVNWPCGQFTMGFKIPYDTGNQKCNWYTGTITVNSELDTASNDIYFLNMQLFPW